MNAVVLVIAIIGGVYFLLIMFIMNKSYYKEIGDNDEKFKIVEDSKFIDYFICGVNINSIMIRGTFEVKIYENGIILQPLFLRPTVILKEEIIKIERYSTLVPGVKLYFRTKIRKGEAFLSLIGKNRTEYLLNEYIKKGDENV